MSGSFSFECTRARDRLLGWQPRQWANLVVMLITATERRPPASVTMYGLLGLVPFLAPPATMALRPDWGEFAAQLLALYAGLILSFLGGARWGFANARPAPSFALISWTMVPTLAALALLLLPAEVRRVQLALLAVALAVQWIWDVSADGLPSWYPWLRSILSSGAILGLAAGAALSAS